MATAKPKGKTAKSKDDGMEAQAAAEQQVTTIEAPVKAEETGEEKVEVTIEKKLYSLYNLQQTDSQIDRIKIIRGELPLEVQDLEDEIEGLQTRLENLKLEMESLEKQVLERKQQIKDSQALIKKYEEQQMNVRNNREYDSLSKEIEFQGLELQLCEKRIREFTAGFELKKEAIAAAEANLAEKTGDLEAKKAELQDIVDETEKEELALVRKSEEHQKFIEDRLLTAYHRIRKNARNGLAVVQIERGACGGCFNKIPPQHQLEISMHKKIIVCEYCGRILVDDAITQLGK
jgi:hypothetical protein